ncbi:RNA polymerase subunit sigma-70 [Microlunatus flavus]|uniref:RNA polymerase sigma factor n=1 Tax=Microlunatus flavus TaxID=1036181 RepID=A0A1H9L8L3_9ACTN|nr:RNA polymerase subunit sigma-70 [Microlunatus flavus]SER07648.1 RNA polymerase sigma-70 factor, ECF subfamily [Microlunatus flavus]
MSLPGEDDFDAAADSFRRELLVHCYRMLGSFDEAEDLVQETMLRAWRARERFDPARASLRTWLYRIATNACLTALEGRARRALPSQLYAASEDPETPLVPDLEVPWLQPLPARHLLGSSADPQERSAELNGVRLALVAALQVLPPRQRAVLVLRDVLQFSAVEVAHQLSSTVAGVNSALQRARATIAHLRPEPEMVVEPDDPTERSVVQRYVEAFEAADVAALVALLSADVELEMPPVPLWYRGRADYGRFMNRVFAMRGDGWRMVATSANGQPALAAYCPDGGDRLALHTLQVLTVTRYEVSRNVVFADPTMLEAFGLAPVLVR